MNWHLVAEIVLIFLVYAVLGFVLEVIFVAVTEGKVENRGFLAGPVVPIYAFGALAVIHALEPFSRNPAWVFVGGALICTTLEGVTGWALMKIFHRRWWDYSDKPFNIGGYVCLQMALLWGVACLLLVNVLEPLVAGVVGWLPAVVVYLLAGVGLLLFVIDFVTSVAAATHLKKSSRALDEVTGELRKVSDRWSSKLGQDGLELGARAEKAQADVASAKQSAKTSVADRRAELEAKRAQLLKAEPRGVRRLRRAFPRVNESPDHQPASARVSPSSPAR